jgi:hypothetical protein
MADKQKRKSSLFGKKKLRDLSISSPHEGTFKHGIHAETSDDIFKVCSSAAFLCVCVVFVFVFVFMFVLVDSISLLLLWQWHDREMTPPSPPPPQQQQQVGWIDLNA